MSWISWRIRRIHSSFTSTVFAFRITWNQNEFENILSFVKNRQNLPHSYLLGAQKQAWTIQHILNFLVFFLSWQCHNWNRSQFALILSCTAVCSVYKYERVPCYSEISNDCHAIFGERKTVWLSEWRWNNSLGCFSHSFALLLLIALSRLNWYKAQRKYS